MSAEQAADWRNKFDKNAKAVQTTFSTADGETVLALLKNNFGASSVFNENPYIMARNAGQHELVQYIEVLIERGKSL